MWELTPKQAKHWQEVSQRASNLVFKHWCLTGTRMKTLLSVILTRWTRALCPRGPAWNHPPVPAGLSRSTWQEGDRPHPGSGSTSSTRAALADRARWSETSIHPSHRSGCHRPAIITGWSERFQACQLFSEEGSGFSWLLPWRINSAVDSRVLLHLVSYLRVCRADSRSWSCHGSA